MDKWTQRIIAAAALIFALSVAGWVVKPRASGPRYQFVSPSSWPTVGIFDSRTGLVYRRVGRGLEDPCDTYPCDPYNYWSWSIGWRPPDNANSE